MPGVGDTIHGTDLDSYYVILNAVRAKHGLGAVSKPVTASYGNNVTSTDMWTIPDYMTLTSQQAPYIPDKVYSISGVSPGLIIRAQVFDEISSGLSEINSYCNDHYNHYNYDDYSESDYSAYNTGGDYTYGGYSDSGGHSDGNAIYTGD